MASPKLKSGAFRLRRSFDLCVFTENYLILIWEFNVNQIIKAQGLKPSSESFIPVDPSRSVDVISPAYSPSDDLSYIL